MTDRTGSPPSLYECPAGHAAASAAAGIWQACAWVAANFEELITALLLGRMIGSIRRGVLCRDALRMPNPWTEA